MRLRQIALVAKDLEPVVDALRRAFGLQVAYRDPAVAAFGLINVVMPVGGEFLEIVQPVTKDASAGRYLQRRGGDAGYMLIFQCSDALTHRKRLVDEGVRIIAEHQSRGYTFTHFHPGDFGGVLTSIDMVEDGSSWHDRMGKWPPAGKSWRESGSPADIRGILGATVQARDPVAAASKWTTRLAARQEGPSVLLEQGVIRFIEPIDADGTGIVAIDVAVKDAEAVLARARDASLTVRGETIEIGGVAFKPVSVV